MKILKTYIFTFLHPSLRFQILPELIIISKDSEDNLQQRPQPYLYLNKKDGNCIYKNQIAPENIPS